MVLKASCDAPPLIVQCALDGLDEIWNQIVASCQLYIDLSKSVLDPIASVDQPVVYTNCPEHDCGDNCEENQE